MNTFHLASRLNHIAPFHVMELVKMAAELERQGRHIIHMSIGEPDFGAAEPVLAAAAGAMRDGRMQYTAATGLPALREAISQHYRDRFGLSVPASRIVVTAGASAALLLTCAALIDKGDEVLMPDPSYPCNRHFVAAFDGIARTLACEAAQRYQLSAQMVADNWQDSTRGVLLASPSNPTGTSIDADELARIVDVVRKRQGFVVVDEIYQGLTYDAAPFSALSLGEDIIVINSFSKYFGMTGWRLGWVVIPESLFAPIEKLAQNFFICPSSIAQQAALACFSTEALEIFEDRKAEFKRRRDYLIPALQQLGFKVPVVPDGAFYLYADCSGLTNDANQFAIDALNEAGVAFVPGHDFGVHTANTHVRFSYATSLENLQEAVARLTVFVRSRT